MHNSRVSFSYLALVSRHANEPAGSRWWSLVRDRVVRWRASRARADELAAEDLLDAAWTDTAASLHAGDQMGVDGAPAMVFTDSMPPYPAHLDRPQSTTFGSADARPSERAVIGAGL